MNTTSLGISLSERLIALGFIRISGLKTTEGRLVEEFEIFDKKNVWSEASVSSENNIMFFVHFPDNGIWICKKPTENRETIEILRKFLPSLQLSKDPSLAATTAYEICFKDGLKVKGVLWRISSDSITKRQLDPDWVQ